VNDTTKYDSDQQESTPDKKKKSAGEELSESPVLSNEEEKPRHNK
jgi:hypothetical protein